MELARDKTCFLVLPGFAPDDYPVLSLRDKIISQGYHAVAWPFWGDTKNDDSSTLTIEKCKEGIANAVSTLSKQYEMVIGIGTSLGGVLLMEHAKTHDDLNYIISIGTPFKLKNRVGIGFLFFIYPIIHFFYKIWHFIGIKRLLPVEFADTMVKYLEGDFLKGLEKIKTPLLLVHGRNDAVADVSVLPFFMDKISSVKKNIIYFKKLHHTMIYDDKMIIDLTLEFITGEKNKNLV